MTQVNFIRGLLPDGSLPAESQAFVSAQVAQEAGQFIIVGAGRPDITGTLDPDTASRVAAAASGAVFRSTTGPQGAWEWMRQGSTWVCTSAWTGWRDISDRLQFGWAGTAHIARSADEVHLRIKTTTTGTDRTLLSALPAGFTSAGGFRYPIPALFSTTAAAPAFVEGSFVRVDVATSPTQPRYVAGSWLAASTVPTTLPGVAV